MSLRRHWLPLRRHGLSLRVHGMPVRWHRLSLRTHGVYVRWHLALHWHGLRWHWLPLRRILLLVRLEVRCVRRASLRVLGLRRVVGLRRWRLLRRIRRVLGPHWHLLVLRWGGRRLSWDNRRWRALELCWRRGRCLRGRRDHLGGQSWGRDLGNHRCGGWLGHLEMIGLLDIDGWRKVKSCL